VGERWVSCRKCNLTTVVREIMANHICADEGCETVIQDQDLLHSGACNLVVSGCILLFRKIQNKY
jgi:hypothetical protein